MIKLVLEKEHKLFEYDGSRNRIPIPAGEYEAQEMPHPGKFEKPWLVINFNGKQFGATKINLTTLPPESGVKVIAN